MCVTPGSIRSDNPPRCVPHWPLLPGLLVRGARVATARALNCAESSTAERRSRRTAARVHGRDPAAGLKRDGEVSDQSGLVSESGQFRSESWPCSRLMLVSRPGEASRPLGSSGAPELFLTVSPVCSRLNECSGACLRVFSATEWSVAAAKLASLPSGAGGTVRILGAIESRWVHGRRGASGERSASVRSVKPGCCPGQPD